MTLALLLSSAPRLRVRAYLTALPALIMKNERAKSLAVYTADALRMIGESTARYAGGPYMTGRWIDLAEPKKQDNRTGEEIAADVIRRCGLVAI